MGKFNKKSEGSKNGGRPGGRPGGKRPDGYQFKSKPNMKKKSNPSAARPDSNKTENTPKPTPKVLNPFEVKVNKQKFQVLGRPTKHERGLPGVSRAKALKKRTHTLLQEYKNRFKSNKLVDKRLGENNPKLSVEGKMEMRFLAEKIKSQNKVEKD